VGEDGQSPAIDKSPFGVRIADQYLEAARSEALLHSHQMLLSPGRKKVGLAILDLFGRESAVVTRFVAVGPQSEPTEP
jgi:hypothetical protein